MRCLFYLLIGLFTAGLTACNNHLQTSRQQIFSLLQQGENHAHQDEIKKALICYWDALDLLSNKQDTVLKAQTYNQLGDLLFRYGLYEKAAESHRESYLLAQRATNGKLLYETTRKLTIDYLLLNQQDTANYFLSLCNRIAQAHQLSSPSLPEKEDLPQLASSLKADSTSTLFQREELLNWATAYKAQKAEQQAVQAKNREVRQIIAFTGTLLLLAALLAITYKKKKAEKKRREEQSVWFAHILQQTKEELTSYQAELFDSRQHIDKLQKSLQAHQESASEYQRIQQELENYTKQTDRLRQRESALKQREKQLLSEASMQAIALLNQLKSHPSYLPIKSTASWKTLHDFACLLYPEYKTRLAQAEGLTERERELSCLIQLGFTTGQLAVFYGISPGSVTKAKFRLQKKMESAIRSSEENLCCPSAV